MLARIVALLVGAVVLVLGFMFSVVVLAVVAVLGTIGLAYFWWKTRALRQALREQQAQAQSMSADGAIIEGEAVIVEVSGQRGLPDGNERQ